MEYTNTKGLDESEDVSEQEDELELQSIIKSEMDSAKDFIEQIGQERDEATRYYLGKEPSATSELQSEFISTDVRDSILFTSITLSKKRIQAFMFSTRRSKTLL